MDLYGWICFSSYIGLCSERHNGNAEIDRPVISSLNIYFFYTGAPDLVAYFSSHFNHKIFYSAEEWQVLNRCEEERTDEV